MTQAKPKDENRRPCPNRQFNRINIGAAEINQVLFL